MPAWIRIFLVAVVFLGLEGVAAAAAPKAELWERWQAHDPESGIRLAHAEWAEFLRKYLRKSPDRVTRLPYGKVSPADKKSLSGYIDRLASVPVSLLSRAEQLPYWINLYNALTVKVVLDHFPVSSILRIGISPGWFSFGPWDKKLIIVEGERISLNDIEHRILRPIWRDPRIHYAVNCASVSCPNLAAVPYAAETAEKMLTEAAKAYVNHPRGVKWNSGGLVVSSIYHWYILDFGGTDSGVISHLKKYASPGLAARLEKVLDIHNHEYDWELNNAVDGSAQADAN
jgi:hypothetical protein